MPTPNLDLYLAIPAYFSEEMTEEDWNNECRRMFRSSQLTRQFIEGKISPADLEDGLADLGIDPFEIAQLWENGHSLLIGV